MPGETQIRFPSVQTAEFVDTRRPDRPLAPNEVEGKTHYTLVSNGTEMHIYLGRYEEQDLQWGRFPFVPGYAASFQVERVGTEVQDIKPGDIAFCMGKHCSYQRITRAEMLPVPPALSPEVAPFARLMNVTMSTASTTTARPPARVVVTGLGPIGLIGALVFQRCGYRVTAIDPVPARRQTATEAGVRDVRPAAPLDDPALVQQVALVVECSGHEQAALDSIRLLEPGGELVQVGAPMARRTEIFAQEMLIAMFWQNCRLRGGSEWQVPRQPTDYRPNSIFGQMAAALDWLADGSIDVRTFYEVVPPTDPQQIYQDILHQRRPKLCCVFDWQSLWPANL